MIAMRTIPPSGNKSVIDFAAIGHERSLLAAAIDGIDLPGRDKYRPL